MQAHHMTVSPCAHALHHSATPGLGVARYTRLCQFLENILLNTNYLFRKVFQNILKLLDLVYKMSRYLTEKSLPLY